MIEVDTLVRRAQCSEAEQKTLDHLAGVITDPHEDERKKERARTIMKGVVACYDLTAKTDEE